MKRVIDRLVQSRSTLLDGHAVMAGAITSAVLISGGCTTTRSTSTCELCDARELHLAEHEPIVVDYTPPTASDGLDPFTGEPVFAVGRDCDIFVRPREGGLTYDLKEVVEIDYTLDTSSGSAVLKIGFYGHGKEGSDTSLWVAYPPIDVLTSLRAVSGEQTLAGTSSSGGEYVELWTKGWGLGKGEVMSTLVTTDGSSSTNEYGYIAGAWKEWSNIEIPVKTCSDTSGSTLPKLTLDTSRPVPVIRVEYMSECFEFGVVTSHGAGG